MGFKFRRIILLALWLTLLLVVAGCKVPLDERQAVAELQKKTSLLEQELESSNDRQQNLEKKLDTLQLRFDEARDQLLKQAEELQALNQAQTVMKEWVETKLSKVGKVSKNGKKVAAVDQPVSPPLSEEEEQVFEKLYTDSLTAYHNGDYEDAVKLFAAFLRDFPNTVKAANARYWLGESYYSLAQYAQAITEFKRVQKDFPTSSKVPGALLKTAMSYEAIGGREPALAAYVELSRKYPASLSAKLAEKALARLE
ncbi:MAG: tol-pal system protein YbgF [Deltaproteobacteria bacterium]|nr:tol-pal system protein YbgF [Deltaproteobacteria bacterium]